jgi:ABC-type multidrug transport system fused ATPase/permease subunit
VEVKSTQRALIEPASQKGSSQTSLVVEKSNKSPALSNKRQETNWKLYQTYAEASGLRGVILFLGALVAARFFSSAIDIWLKVWTDASEQQGATTNHWAYILTYLALGIASAVAPGAQIYFLLAHCSLQVRSLLLAITAVLTSHNQASKTLNERLSHAVFHSPMSFFETTAFGEIITRFSTNMNQVDDRVARFFSSMISPRTRTAVILLIIAWSKRPSLF